jgi:predicted nucleic acid-binding protein
MLLLDTNVISATRRTQRIADWLADKDPSRVFLSVLTLGEIDKGARSLAARDPAASRFLAGWLELVRAEYSSRLLTIDEAIALEWGRLAAIRTRGIVDGLLAATARVHGLTVATRNVADFADTGVAVVNPWGD